MARLFNGKICALSGPQEKDDCLVERVGARSPPGEEQTQSNRLEYTTDGTNGDRVEGPFLRENLSQELSSNVSLSEPYGWEILGKHTLGAELAKKISVPR
jgi:hypothetical protein